MIFEIMGYLGTAFVVVSFMCKSLLKLRVLNSIGALLVTIYAVVIKAYPVAILDGFILIINLYQIYTQKD